MRSAAVPGLYWNLAIAFHEAVQHHSCMASRRSHSKGLSWGVLPSSIELIDKLPSWAKVIFLVAGVACFFYSIAHYGLGTTLLRAIFSP